MYTRRETLKLGAAIGITAIVSRVAHAEEKSIADTIITNGRIATQDESRSFAVALTIKDGRFVAVGNEQEVMVYKGDQTQVIDVDGRTVIPGLNDSLYISFVAGSIITSSYAGTGSRRWRMACEC